MTRNEIKGIIFDIASNLGLEDIDDDTPGMQAKDIPDASRQHRHLLACKNYCPDLVSSDPTQYHHVLMPPRPAQEIIVLVGP